MDAVQWIENTGEPRARKRASAVRRRAGGKGLCKQYLACCLSYFLLGFIGSKEEAREIKAKIRVYLKEQLHLELSQEKTLITHARKEAAHFLGYEIITKHSKTHKDVNGAIGLRIPKAVVDEKCKESVKKDFQTYDIIQKVKDEAR